MTDVISISVAGRKHKAALALPSDRKPPFPAVVVIQDITGFSRDLRRHVDRFAEAGYAALGPDLYGGGNPVCVVKTLMSAQKGEGLGYEVIEAARTALAARDDVDASRIGVVGFCLGGGFALMAAANHEYAVAAPFYGVVPYRASRLQGLCPTIAQYGGQDTAFMPHARRLAKHLEELGIEHEVHIYDEAGHSFMNQLSGPVAPLIRHTSMKARYEPETEAKAWAKLLDFFERHIGDSSSPGAGPS